MVLLAACTGSAAPGTTVPPSTVGPTMTVTQPPAVPPCLDGERAFTDDGLVGVVGEATGDAVILTAVSWTSFPDCESIVVDFATDQAAPAVALGPTQIRLLPGPNIVRIELPDSVVDTALADVLFEGTIVSRAYVVSGAGGLFLDIHLAAPASARAFALSSPGRLIIDVRQRSAEDPGAPTLGRDVVVLDPWEPETGYPITIAGYLRKDAVARLENGDDVIEQVTVEAPGYPWTEFSLRFAEGPLGVVRVKLETADEILEVPLVAR